jgi:hypothetical protein
MPNRLRTRETCAGTDAEVLHHVAGPDLEAERGVQTG